MTDFEKLVAEMRKAQKEFFRRHDYGVLKRSKELEKQVDQYISELEKGPDLFNGSCLQND